MSYLFDDFDLDIQKIVNYTGVLRTPPTENGPACPTPSPACPSRPGAQTCDNTCANTCANSCTCGGGGSWGNIQNPGNCLR